MIDHSPSPEMIAKEFLVELGKCEIVAVKNFGDGLLPYVIVIMLNDICANRRGTGQRSLSPNDWVAIVHQELRQSGRNLTNITKLASYYLSHLVIACRVQPPLNLVSEIRFSQSEIQVVKRLPRIPNPLLQILDT